VAGATRKTPEPKPCPVEAYARAVLAGEVVAGRLVKLACARHLRDLEEGPARGLRWDRAAAAFAIGFFGFLKQSKGEWAGQPLTLQPWQAFVVGSIFGWKGADGTRRFKTAYEELARKNGKSTVAAGIGLLLAFFSGEPGAEVYTAATKRDQARIVHSEAVRMVKASPVLRQRVRVYKDNLNSEATNSKYEPLGADADTLDGLNPNGVIVDELHAHKTRAMLDVLETATGARREPLTFVITTAGVAGESVYGETHDYAEKVLDGRQQDDTFFAFVAAIDEGDSWQDEACWPKANPNLGVSVKIDDLRRKAEKAKAMPGALMAFLRLHLNVRTQVHSAWLDIDRWDACAAGVEAAALEGRECYAGLDLASTTDVAALVLLFSDGGAYDVLPCFWVPENACRQRERTNKTRFDAWVRAGLVEATPGDVIDYDRIRAKINELNERYHVKEIAIDRWNSTQLAAQLGGDGFEVVGFGQGFASMSAPTKELEGLILSGRLRHGGHPVLRWMAGNVAVEQDAAGNLKPSKKKSTEKIDGVVALVMALGRAMLAPPEGSWYSPGCLGKD